MISARPLLKKLKVFVSPSSILMLYLLLWFVYFARFWSRALFMDGAGNLVAGHVNIWGDWAAHFTMGSSLAERGLWLTHSPFLIGAKFAYPYAANALSGGLMQLGLPFVSSFVVPSFIFSCLTVVALVYFYDKLFSSKAVAIIASLIFLLNGGLGFWYFGQDILNSPQPLETFTNPPHEYTRLDTQNIKWISVIDSMLIPQRAFTHGFPLALLALGWLYAAGIKSEVIEKKPSPFLKKLRTFGPVAVLLGVLPLIHTHSFLAAGVILAGWSSGQVLDLALQGKTKLIKSALAKWLLVAVIAAVLAIPLLKFFILNQVGGFIQWYPGWLASDYHMNWFEFWFKNWGITPILAIVGWWLAGRKNKQSQVQTFYTWAPFFVLFILVNLFLFQPFVWDNTKLLVWASVGISGLAGFCLVQLWKKANHLKWFKQLALKKIIAILFLITIASGAIDAYWIQRRNLHSYTMYSAEELELAQWVRVETPVEAVWLTGDQHNHWLFNLTGRQTLMTYRGWLWTHGYAYLPVEHDVSLMFQFPEQSELFKKYQVEYVVIGPNEMKVWGAQPSKFDQQFAKIRQTKHFSIYKVSN